MTDSSKLPLVSVVIPTLDRLVMLQQAVASIQAQTYPHVELVVADNGSTDGSQEWLTSAEIRWVTATTRGTGIVRREGVKVATGELVFFLDSDDLAEPDAIEALVARWQQTQTDMVYGRIKNQMLESASKIKLHEPSVQYPAPLASSSLLRRSVFERFGPFLDANNSWAGWYLRARDVGLTESTIDQVVSIRRIHDSNVSHEAENKSYFFDIIRQRLAKNAE